MLLFEYNLTLGREFKGNKNGKEQRQFYEVLFIYNVKPNPVYIVNISAGEHHVLALDFDRNVWAWGTNINKQINPFEKQNDFPLPIKIEHKVIKINHSTLIFV